SLSVLTRRREGDGSWGMHCENRLRLFPRGMACLFLMATGSAWAGTPPAFSVQPVSATTILGQEFQFQVTTTGDVPQTFQWYQGAQVIPGATSSTLTINAALFSSAGTYTVTATNATGSATSTAASLTVNPAVPPTFASEPPATVSVPYGSNQFYMSVAMNGS